MTTKNAMIRLDLINEDHLTAPDSSEFQSWVSLVASAFNTDGDVCIKIVDETESQFLNLTYRKKDKPTNVLSFPLMSDDFIETEHLGDLAICAAVVEKEAKQQGKPINHHWAHMTIHGLLHLLGYDHIEDAEAEEMEALEAELLQELGISNPYE